MGARRRRQRATGKRARVPCARTTRGQQLRRACCAASAQQRRRRAPGLASATRPATRGARSVGGI
eukprot:141799-Chlamydomonas_euryale.AAC.1